MVRGNKSDCTYKHYGRNVMSFNVQVCGTHIYHYSTDVISFHQPRYTALTELFRSYHVYELLHEMV